MKKKKTKQEVARSSRKKGNNFENKVLKTIKEFFPERFENKVQAPRRTGRGFGNQEFINLEWMPVYIEAKDWAQFSLDKWVPQAQKDAVLAGKPWSIVAHLRGSKYDFIFM